MEKKKNINWLAIILAIVAVIGGIFSIVSAVNLNKEKQARIEAQNEVARQAEVIQEGQNRWSKLSLQLEDINSILKDRDEDLAGQIKQNNENILVLTETIAQIKGTKIIIREENIREIPIEEGRVEVEFDQTEDPIRVFGNTITNPPQAEINIEFIRPLRLRSTVVQNEDGSWKTYFQSDWNNLQIQDIETIVNPLVSAIHRRPRENIVFGMSILTSGKFDTLNSTVYGLYDFGFFSIGPSLGLSLLNGNARGIFGLNVQFSPWRQK